MGLRHRLRTVLLRYSAALLLLALCLGATALGWHHVRVQAQAAEQARFELGVERAKLAVLERLGRCGAALRGAQSLYAASKSVERDEWAAYIGGLSIEQNYPGLQGMSYVVRVPAAGLKPFLDQTRADNAPSFNIHPPGDRADYLI